MLCILMREVAGLRRDGEHEGLRQAQKAIGDRSHSWSEQGRSVQTDNNQSDLPVVHDFRELLRGISVREQRLGVEPLRHDGEEVLEPVVGHSPAIALNSGKMEPRGQRGSNRLDHIGQDRREIQRVCDAPRRFSSAPATPVRDPPERRFGAGAA